MFSYEQFKLLAEEVLVHLEYADKCLMMAVTTCPPAACHVIFLIQDIITSQLLFRVTRVTGQKISASRP